MSAIHPIDLTTWGGELPTVDQAIATDALEAGHVLFLSDLRFELSDAEYEFLCSEIKRRSSGKLTFKLCTPAGAAGIYFDARRG